MHPLVSKFYALQEESHKAAMDVLVIYMECSPEKLKQLFGKSHRDIAEEIVLRICNFSVNKHVLNEISEVITSPIEERLTEGIKNAEQYLKILKEDKILVEKILKLSSD